MITAFYWAGAVAAFGIVYYTCDVRHHDKRIANLLTALLLALGWPLVSAVCVGILMWRALKRFDDALDMVVAMYGTQGFRGLRDSWLRAEPVKARAVFCELGGIDREPSPYWRNKTMAMRAQPAMHVDAAAPAPTPFTLHEVAGISDVTPLRAGKIVFVDKKV